MKRKIGVAALLAMMALGAFTPSAFAQCTNILIKFDADCFSYESDAFLSAVQPDGFQAWRSNLGSQLTVVGLCTLFCSPLNGLVPDLTNPDPSQRVEYSFVWTSLTASGPLSGAPGSPATSETPLGSTGTRWATNYSGGHFYIYKNQPADAPRDGSMPPGPPNATVPANFQNGTLILEGPLNGLITSSVRSSTTWSGTFTTTYSFTGGTLYNTVLQSWNYGGGLPLQGNWCLKYPTGCTPSGYTAHADGQWLPASPTGNKHSTWGAIKELYR
ncbi:MAG: hypothetical protein HY076_03175 [Candidatus Eisenbacteria bacterium]|uniref:Uncharacterized protein n=1 Tax=Eiseniibacteriota bacterium TaxID=2212470 RepID=A0A9D6QJK4_UNCEI|nr:hypothetical protein [Candidatus Eisenbacteria bacterium]MBI3539256.1 hypothetical protein [Candidatus Eisenbacteria bacterium]